MYEHKSIWAQKTYLTIPNHWNDRKKLRKDYKYLKNLHHLLLKNLSKALNSYHNVNYSDRCWQIIIDPWLLTYVGTVFDRWECLRKAFKKYKKFKTYKFYKKEKLNPAYNCSEFHKFIQDDYWNYKIFLEIIKYQYSKQCIIKDKTKTSKIFVIPNNYLEKKESNYCFKLKNIFKKIVVIVDKLLCKITSQNKIIFYKSYFPILELWKINLSLFQLPKFFLEEFKELNPKKYIQEKYYQRKRAKLKLYANGKNPFERFLISRIIKDMPITYVEMFNSFRNKLKLIPAKPRLILTANGYWVDDIFKLWSAEQVKKGCRFITIQHGGSLTQGSMFAFDFEENISDNFITWSQPCHSKHVRLSPTKLIGFRPKKSSKKYCSLIGCEWPRYAFRIQASPISGQTLRHYMQAIRFYHFLKPEIKEKFRVKPYENQGWNLRQRFIDDIGMNKVYEKQCFNHVLSMSRVVVVTYPETAFSESMLSGLPTILLYPYNLWELHPFMQPLLTTLKKSKIAFHNSKAAAFHLNSIWNHADLWWRSPDVLVAREKFKRIAVDTKKDWLKQWKDFISEKTDKTLV